MKDKRDECGCHRECSYYIPHDCPAPCVFPNCLTDADHDQLRAELAAEEKGQ